MEDFCPLCMKNNIKRRIKAFQINLEEAMWACEGKECIWPIGYHNLTFLQRIAISADLDESPKETHDQIPMSMELALYTPPVTPIGQSVEISVNPPTEEKLDETSKNESTNSRRDIIESNMPSFEPHRIESNNFIEENEKVTKEKITSTNACSMLSKIATIQKTNSDITTILEDANTDFDRKKIQKYEQSVINLTSIVNTAKNPNVLFDDTLCKEFILNTRCKTESEQSKNDNAQSDNTVIYLQTNSNIETSSSVTKLEDKSSTNLNDSLFNIPGSDLTLDMILDDLSKESASNEDISDLMDLLI